MSSAKCKVIIWRASLVHWYGIKDHVVSTTSRQFLLKSLICPVLCLQCCLPHCLGRKIFREKCFFLLGRLSTMYFPVSSKSFKFFFDGWRSLHISFLDHFLVFTIFLFEI